jgi:hypothetical protein
VRCQPKFLSELPQSQIPVFGNSVQWWSDKRNEKTSRVSARDIKLTLRLATALKVVDVSKGDKKKAL